MIFKYLANRKHKRSPKWPALRRRFVKSNPFCAACGRKRFLEIHHVLPYHEYPKRELDPANLITLCDFPIIARCHLKIGHLGDWRKWNPNVREDAMTNRSNVSYINLKKEKQ